MRPTDPRRRASRRGLTITELLVVLLVVAIVLAALLPIATRIRHDSGQSISMANLQSIGMAHALYGAVWNDRQVTWVPDDLGLFAGNPQAYTAAFGCPGQHVLGWGTDQSVWGYYLPCALGGSSWNNIQFYVPNAWNDPGAGAFRTPGSKALSPYIDGRYYSPLLYAPNDTVTYGFVEQMFDIVGEFQLLPAPAPQIVFSSYAMSPAAMWHPSVYAENADGAWWTNPNTLPLGYTSPTVSQCLHPALKTRMIEHNWNLGQPAPVNPAFAGGQTPYFFSHGLAAAPLTLFFDGHVAALPNSQVAADDAAVLASTGGTVGLWSRDTPQGTNGYYGGQSFDGFVTGHHVFTAGGILGRDVLGNRPPDPEGASGDGRRAAFSAAGNTPPRRRPGRPTGIGSSNVIAPPGSLAQPTAIPIW